MRVGILKTGHQQIAAAVQFQIPMNRRKITGYLCLQFLCFTKIGNLFVFDPDLTFKNVLMFFHCENLSVVQSDIHLIESPPNPCGSNSAKVNS